MEAHSKFSPSRLERIIPCTISTAYIDALLASKKIKESEPSIYALEGTLQHERTQDYFINRDDNALVDLTPDQKSNVLDCIDYADMLITGLGHKNFTFKLETHISLDSFGIPDVWGTSDFILIDFVSKRAHVIDWKFGSGIIVYAKENPQLYTYAAGSIGWPTDIKEIVLHIFQPAVDHISTHVIPTIELFNWVHTTLAPAIGKAQLGLGDFNPGEKQCRWCEARNHCEARMEYAKDIATKLFYQQEMLERNLVDFNALVQLTKEYPTYEQCIKSVKKYLMSELQHGRDIPGVKLVEGRANRKWQDEGKAIEWLSKNTQIDELFVSKLMSPSQIEKLDKGLKKNEDFQKLYIKPEGKTTLAYTEDKRKALKPKSKAIDVFTDILD